MISFKKYKLLECKLWLCCKLLVCTPSAPKLTSLRLFFIILTVGPQFYVVEPLILFQFFKY